MDSLTWRAPLDRWLADVAVAVYADVPRYAAVLLPGPDGMDYRAATA
ncbi:MAG TPA: hypothetical protein VJ914_17225 [Pseudonocardiaceae bacterium]|nr:hypothetical protein [Pseudonocardiaceae bacterium]